jgi:hypothetical protein
MRKKRRRRSKPGAQRGEGYLRDELVQDGSRGGGGGGGGSAGDGMRGSRWRLGSWWPGRRERAEELGGEGLPAGELALALGAEPEERAAATAEAGDLGVGARSLGRLGGGRGVGVEPAGNLVDEPLVIAYLELLLLLLLLLLLWSLACGGGRGHGLRRGGRGRRRAGRRRRRPGPQPRGSAHRWRTGARWPARVGGFGISNWGFGGRCAAG